MAYHVGPVFFEDQDGAGALQNLGALADPLSALWPRDGDNADLFRADGRFRALVGLYAGIDATVQPRARLTAPSFRERLGRTALEFPFLPTTNEPGSPPLFHDLRDDPILFDPGERVGFETLNNPAAAANQYAVCFVADGPVQAVDPKGGYWARFTTAAAALTADTWGSRALVEDERLKSGFYDVLAFRPISTSLIASRLSFVDQVNKPGVLGADARGDIPHASFMRPGAWGPLGRFHTDNLPAMEALVDAADNEAQVADMFIRRAR